MTTPSEEEARAEARARHERGELYDLTKSRITTFVEGAMWAASRVSSNLPHDPEWDHLSDLRGDHFEAARDRVVEEARNVAHLDGTGIIGRLIAVVDASRVSTPPAPALDVDEVAQVLCRIEGRSTGRSLDEVVAPGIELWMRHRYEAERLIEELSPLLAVSTPPRRRGAHSMERIERNNLGAAAWRAYAGDLGHDLGGFRTKAEAKDAIDTWHYFHPEEQRERDRAWVHQFVHFIREANDEGGRDEVERALRHFESRYDLTAMARVRARRATLRRGWAGVPAERRVRRRKAGTWEPVPAVPVLPTEPEEKR